MHQSEAAKDTSREGQSGFIEISELGKCYPGSRQSLWAIRDLSMQAAKGEVLALLGPSGCGKTTLLRILGGILTPSEGTASIGGLTTAEFRDTQGVGLVFQKPLLLPWRTVLQNVLLPTEIRRQADSERTLTYARTLLTMMRLSAVEGSYPRSLSGGMFQRAALARGLILRPQLLLLDEPFSALDEVTRELLWFDFLNMWTSEKPTVVLVTHSVQEACFLGTRVLILTRGPGKVGAAVSVNLPSPRDESVMASREFTDLCDHVRGVLRQCAG